MTGISSELDRLLDEADYRARKAQHRDRLSRSVFEAHRRKQLADVASLHPLRRHRLAFRDGLTVAELSERSTVGESTLHDLERGKPGSDQSWARLCRALNCRRDQIDPTYVKT